MSEIKEDWDRHTKPKVVCGVCSLSFCSKLDIVYEMKQQTNKDFCLIYSGRCVSVRKATGSRRELLKNYKEEKFGNTSIPNSNILQWNFKIERILKLL